MISLETFAARLIKHIRRREPFLAYWHCHGTGILMTGFVGFYFDRMGRSRRLYATGKERQHFLRCIEKMRKEPSVFDLYAVYYNGYETTFPPWLDEGMRLRLSGLIQEGLS